MFPRAIDNEFIFPVQMIPWFVVFINHANTYQKLRVLHAFMSQTNYISLHTSAKIFALKVERKSSVVNSILVKTY